MSDSSPAPRNSHGAEGNPRRSRQGPASLRHHVELQRLASAARVGFRRRFWRAVYLSASWAMCYHRRSLAACNTQAGICTLRFSSCSAIQIAALSPQRSIRACAAHDSFREFRSSSIPFLAGLADLDSQLSPEAMLTQAVEANVRWSMRQILETPEGGSARPKGVWNSSVRSTKSKQAGSVSGVSPARSAVLADYR
jgi:hypothetical protein